MQPLVGILQHGNPPKAGEEAVREGLDEGKTADGRETAGIRSGWP